MYATTQDPAEHPPPASADETVAAARDSGGGPVERACRLPREHLRRIERGYHRVHSEDVTFVPKEPNYWGSFDIVSHSGPWDYLQTVPLVLYGPGYIVPQGAPSERGSQHHRCLSDGGASARRRASRSAPARVLENALVPAPVEPPKVIVSDHVGRRGMQRARAVAEPVADPCAVRARGDLLLRGDRRLVTVDHSRDAREPLDRSVPQGSRGRRDPHAQRRRASTARLQRREP